MRVLLDIIHSATRLFDEEKQNCGIEKIELRDIDDVDFNELFSWFEIEKKSFEEFGYNMEKRDVEKHASITATDIAREDMKRGISQLTNKEILEELENAKEGVDRDDWF